MKSLFTKILFLALLITNIGNRAYSQGVWRSMTDFFSARDFATGFAIGDYGYVGLGLKDSSSNNVALDDLWQYDPNTDTWKQVASYIGVARWAATAFVVGDRAWVGTGRNPTSSFQDFFMYEPATNTWTQKASFPGASRRGAAAFAIDGKGYVAAGWNSPNYYNDMYEYDTASDSWTAKASVGSSGFNYPFSFSYGGKGYIGGGNNAGNYNTDFYEYDVANDTWTSKTSFITGRYGAASFVIGDYAYIVGGYDGGQILSDLERYSFAKDSWSAAPANLLKSELSAFFALGGKGYVIAGDSNGNNTNKMKAIHQFDTMNLYTVLKTGTTVCPNTSFDVWVSPTDTFDNGNTFTIQLSDSSGDFTNATDIGYLSDSIGGMVACFIPKNTLSGTNYKVRTVSDMPAMTGWASQLSLQVNRLINPQIIAPSGTTSCAGKSLSLLVDTFTSLNSKNNLLTIVYDASQGQTQLVGATKVYMHSGLADTNLVGTSWFNTIGSGTLDDSIGIMDSLGSNKWSITIDVTNYYGMNFMDTAKFLGMYFRNEDGTLAGKDNSGLDIFVDIKTGIVTSPFGGVTGKWEASYQWLKDGSPISGATLSTIGVNTSGDYQFISIGKNCPDTSAATTIVVGSLPIVGYQITNSTTQCYTGNAFFLMIQVVQVEVVILGIGIMVMDFHASV